MICFEKMLHLDGKSHIIKITHTFLIKIFEIIDRLVGSTQYSLGLYIFDIFINFFLAKCSINQNM